MQTDPNVMKEFQTAVDYLNNSKIAITDENKLKFYAFFKQVTVGVCNTPRPGMFSFVEKAKWDAWHALGSMNSSEAAKGYVSLLSSVAPNWRPSATAPTAAAAPAAAGEQAKAPAHGPVFSQMVRPSDEAYEGPKDVAWFIQKGNTAEVFRLLDSGVSIDTRDEEQRTPLIWAADRGDASLCGKLLDRGANINLQDDSGMTALHYAALCGHKDVVTLLLKRGANRSLKDEEGNTAKDVADGADVKALL